MMVLGSVQSAGPRTQYKILLIFPFIKHLMLYLVGSSAVSDISSSAVWFNEVLVFVRTATINKNTSSELKQR